MKKLKFFGYYSFAVIIYVVFFMFNNDLHIAFKYVGFGLLAIEAVLLFIVFLYSRRTVNENKKIRKMLDDKQYPELEILLKEKLAVETNIIRKDALNYYLMVCLLSENKDGEAIMLFDKITSTSYYPIIYYYKAAVEFYNGCYTNLESLYEEFTGSYEFQKGYNTFKDFDTLFKGMISYYKDDGQLTEILGDLDLEKFKLGCSVKVIEKFKKLLKI